MANVWMHNGFLQVEGQKMSKSLGNFVTINELLETERFGGFIWPGQVVRYAMLKTHYRQPIDFSVKALEEASTELSRFWRDAGWVDSVVEPSDGFLEALCDDLNLPRAIAELHRLAGNQTYAEEIQPGQSVPDASSALESSLVSAAQLVANLKFVGIDLRSYDPKWPTKSRMDEIGGDVAARIATRLAFIRDKNWLEADRIRDELLAKGIQLKDGKDPATGERITTWEVKR
jgi:cysteinyl-tRNA synthetase